MKAEELPAILGQELERRKYFVRMDVLEQTLSLVKIRLYISPELFIQAYRNDRYQTTNLALIYNGQRLYALDFTPYVETLADIIQAGNTPFAVGVQFNEQVLRCLPTSKKYCANSKGARQDLRRPIESRISLRLVRARGEGRFPDSDIDVMIVLRGEFNYWEMDRLSSEFVASLSPENDVVISTKLASETRFAESKMPLYINVRKEGGLV